MNSNKKYLTVFITVFLLFVLFASITGIFIFGNLRSVSTDPSKIIASIIYFITIGVMIGVIIWVRYNNPFKKTTVKN